MAKLSNLPMFFLGALSKDGFVSHFNNAYSSVDGWKAYILKGGAGTGKSTLMKSVASKASDGGENVLLCPCSSDPDSLDGVIMPDRKCIVLDGTPPHTVEPSYPIISEEIINLGEFADCKVLENNRNKIFELYDEKAAYMRRAVRFTSAAAQLLCDAYKTQWTHTDIKKCEGIAKKLVKKYLSHTGSREGKVTNCYLRAITPLGMMYYKNTPKKLCGNVIIIADEYGAAANAILCCIRDEAQKRGCDCIAALDPIFPQKRLDAVMLPRYNIAFCCENKYMHPQSENRRIHSRRFTDAKAISAARQRLTFDKKIAEEMLSQAAASMSAASLAHAKLEKYYCAAMDYEGVAKAAQNLCNKILY